MARRILLDVTELLGLRLNTGVQRVVRELERHLAIRDDIVVRPVIAIDGRLSDITAAGHDLLATPAAPGGAMPPPRGAARRLVERLLARAPALFAAAQHRHFRHRMPAMLAPYRQPGQVAIAPDDILVTADTFWTGSDIAAAAHWARGQGAMVILLIYDMIPVTHPALAGIGLARSFPGLLRRLLAAAHGVLTISHASADEIRRFLDRFALSRPIGVFPLGSDAGQRTIGAPSSVAAWPAGVWTAGARTIITVGTIEPRKGHDTILAAFDRRWRAGSDDRLVMIGKPGAGDGAAALLATLAAHPERNRRLFVLHQVDDAMLADAYARADAGIIASIVEGFGLPLVEALTAGLPVIASDIAVFREIAGDHAGYFTVGDVGDLGRALDRVAPRESEPVAFRWPDWQAASAYFVAQLTTLADPSHQQQPSRS